MVTVDFRPGDIVRVHQKIKEAGKAGEEKERIQVFEGTVLSIRGGEDSNKTFTVRKVVDGIGVERIWPVVSPVLVKIEVKSQPKKRPRRAKLYYLRRR